MPRQSKRSRVESEPWEADTPDPVWGDLSSDERAALFLYRTQRTLAAIEFGPDPGIYDEHAALTRHVERVERDGRDTAMQSIRRRLATARAEWTRISREAVAAAESMVAA